MYELRARWRRLTEWWSRGRVVSQRTFDRVAVVAVSVELGLGWLLLNPDFVPVWIGFSVVAVYVIAAIVAFRRNLLRLFSLGESATVQTQFGPEFCLSPKFIFFGSVLFLVGIGALLGAVGCALGAVAIAVGLVLVMAGAIIGVAIAIIVAALEVVVAILGLFIDILGILF